MSIPLEHLYFVVQMKISAANTDGVDKSNNIFFGLTFNTLKAIKIAVASHFLNVVVNYSRHMYIVINIK